MRLFNYEFILFKILETIKIPSYELALVVPVLVDLKPASTITLTYDDEDTSVVDKKLESIGLITKVEKEKISPRVDVIHVAKTQENLRKLTSLDFFDNYGHGLAYGYPLSAVEAAKNNDFLPKSECPNMKDLIIQFSLSRQNWKEEYELMKKWTAVVKKYTPHIYAAFLKTPTI